MHPAPVKRYLNARRGLLPEVDKKIKGTIYFYYHLFSDRPFSLDTPLRNYGDTGKMVVEIKTRNLIIALIVACFIVIALYALIAPQSQHPVKTILFTKKAPEPIGPYSQGVQHGDFVFVSGQIGLDPATGNLSATVDGQTKQAMENIRAILAEAGLDFTSVVQTRIYLTDLQDFTTVNGVYQNYFEGSYPARATVQVAALPKGAKVEIEVVAKRP